MAVAVIAISPVFLLGALAVQVRVDLEFGPGTLGALVLTFFTSTAVASALLGRAVQRFGSSRSLLLVCGLSGLVFALMASAPDVWLLYLAFVVAGIGNAAAQPAVNLALTEAVRHRRLGLAFGIKQGSVPVATFLGGIAVPTVGLVVGWRPAFALAAVASTAYALRIRRRPVSPHPGQQERTDTPRLDRTMPRATLAVLTAGGMLAAASGTSIGAFLVDSAVNAGLSQASAGLLFAASSVAGLAARVGFGWYVDATPDSDRLRLVALLLVIGAGAYLLIASGNMWLFVAGGVLGYVAGWGWPGVFHYVVVTGNAHTPAVATGIVQTGTSLGAGMGPLVFGLVAEAWSYRAGWLLVSLLALAAAIVVTAANRALRRRT